jgi:hypothetical protein
LHPQGPSRMFSLYSLRVHVTLDKNVQYALEHALMTYMNRCRILHMGVSGTCNAPYHISYYKPSFIRVPDDCSAAVASLYESCLQDDPKLRPSASEVSLALEREFCLARPHDDPAQTPEPSTFGTGAPSSPATQSMETSGPVTPIGFQVSEPCIGGAPS